MEKPKLKPNQYAVGQADFSTGHVLKIDKSVYLENGEIYLIFESKNEALEYIEKGVKENPEIEYWIENSSGEHILTIDKFGQREYKKC